MPPVMLMLALMAGVGLFLSTALAANAAVGEQESTERDELEASEAAAEAALEFDPWTIGEQQLLDARTPIDVNRILQQSSLGIAQARLETSVRNLDNSIGDRKAAEDELYELESVLQAFAIGTFLSSDPELDPHPNAQVIASRREAPLETVTEGVIAEVKRAIKELESARAEEADARALRLALDDELQNRTDAVTRAEQLMHDYDQIVSDRDDELAARTDEAMTQNQRPALAEVRGIRVNVSLAEGLEALLVAADEDGVVLSGWGHRPVDRQISLRITHCGDSGYAIFDMSAGACSPPTARPGHSEHELGLAIDFTENGAVLNAQSPGFVWLVEHGASHGFINLPSEPWHWSTTGH